jgi:hypothetical protein
MVLPADLFSPQRDAAGPSGFADPPRPFVLRAWHLDASEFQAGEGFWFDVYQFEPGDAFVLACEQLRELGAARGGIALDRVEDSHDEIDLCEAVARCQVLRIEFVSPTELKDHSKLVIKPEFAIVARRLITRITNLRTTYQHKPAAVDFSALFEAADQIRMIGHQTECIYTERFSTRTNQTHPLGGFIGWAEYEGTGLETFIPYLRAGTYTGVGRQTVWGKGAIAFHPRSGD